jgi:hypothetical protein
LNRDEAASIAGLTPYQASKRESDLHIHHGWIELVVQDGREVLRRGSSGEDQQVWRITFAGLQELVERGISDS